MTVRFPLNDLWTVSEGFDKNSSLSAPIRREEFYIRNGDTLQSERASGAPWGNGEEPPVNAGSFGQNGGVFDQSAQQFDQNGNAFGQNQAFEQNGGVFDQSGNAFEQNQQFDQNAQQFEQNQQFGENSPEPPQYGQEDDSTRNVILPFDAALLCGAAARTERTGVFTFSRTVRVSKEFSGSKVGLYFEGIEGYSEVYVNGTYVAAHKGETPFRADVTAPIKFDSENYITIKTDTRVKKDVPTAGTDGRSLPSSAFRKVFMEIADGPYIEDVFVRATPSSVEADVTLGDYYPDCEVYAKLYTLGGKEVGMLEKKAVLRQSLTVKGEITEKAFWSPLSPSLYLAVVCLVSGGEVLDRKEIKFGIRSIGFTRNGFYIDGVRTFLKGVVREGSYPDFYRAAPDSLERADARTIKYGLGCNFVRNIGFPSKAFLDECDEIGLMVIPEPSGDGYLGDPSRREAYLGVIKETVLAARNHPCIIAWGVRPEYSPDFDELFFKADKIIAECDGTRKTLGTRTFMRSRMYEGVFGYSDRAKSGKITRVSGTAALNVPYLICNHTGERAGEGLKQTLAHLRVLSAAAGRKYISGAAGGYVSDFATHYKPSGKSVNRGGLTDGYRLPKLAANAYGNKLSAEFGEDGKLYVFGAKGGVKLFRNGDEVGVFHKSDKRYSALEVPPIIIDDFIGNLPMSKNGFTEKQCKTFKSLVRYSLRRGIYGADALTKFRFFLLKRSLKMSKSELRALIKEYASVRCELKLESVSGKESVTFGPSREIKTVVELDKETVVTDGYEAVRGVVKVVDGYGNPVRDADCPVKIVAGGAVANAGDGIVALKDGRAGFYLRTVYVGQGVVNAVSKFGQATAVTEVRYERNDG